MTASRQINVPQALRSQNPGRLHMTVPIRPTLNPSKTLTIAPPMRTLLPGSVRNGLNRAN